MALLPERGADKTMCGAVHCLGIGPSFGKSELHSLTKMTTATSIRTAPRRSSFVRVYGFVVAKRTVYFPSDRSRKTTGLAICWHASFDAESRDSELHACIA